MIRASASIMGDVFILSRSLLSDAGDCLILLSEEWILVTRNLSSGRRMLKSELS